MSAPSRRFFSAVAGLCYLCLADTAHAAFDTVVEHGPSSNRVDAFFLGDGYTQADINAGTYTTQVQNYVNYMFTNNTNSDPFYRYRNYFNIYRVKVVSNESGADEPQNSVTKDTALDATYRYDGSTDRLLYISDAKADAALNAALAGSGKTDEMRYVTVNDNIYGGGGGRYAVYAGGDNSAREIALHEMAHSFSGLADEYGGDTGTYTGAEPTEINVTIDDTGAKWSQWAGYNDPAGGVVGAYEGGRYFDHGIYRPTQDSKMRTLGKPFNAVSREQLILDIYALVNPLDSYDNNAAPLVDPASISATRVDDLVIGAQWFVDGNQQFAFEDQSMLDIASLGLAPGPHFVDLRAYDPTGFDYDNGWVRRNSAELEQYVRWDLVISVPEPGTLVLALTALVALPRLARRRPGVGPDLLRLPTSVMPTI